MTMIIHFQLPCTSQSKPLGPPEMSRVAWQVCVMYVWQHIWKNVNVYMKKSMSIGSNKLF